MHSWDRMSILFKDAKLKSPPLPPPPPAPPPTKNSNRISPKYAPRQTNASSLESSESEELQRLVHAPPFWKNSKKKLSKQMSMNETHRDVAWEKKRQRQVIREGKRKSMNFDADDLTDEDLNELRGSIELGFGFSEEACQKLCNTLPALDLYLAVHRQLSISPVSTPHSNNSTNSLGVRSASFESPRSEDSWKIFGPGDDPQQVKTKLRHWAQVVACSVMQSI